jgi:hypothetical protein
MTSFYSTRQLVLTWIVFLAAFIAAGVIGIHNSHSAWLYILAPFWIGAGIRLRVLHKRHRELAAYIEAQGMHADGSLVDQLRAAGGLDQEEALDPDRADRADRAREFTSSFDPLEVSTTDVRSAAVDLLTRTERVFVELGAPGPLGLLITRASLDGRYHVDDAHPQYGVLLAVTVFGYATRIAQAEQAPLPSHEVAEIEHWIIRNDDGTANYETMGDKPEALQQLGMHAGAMADDRVALLRLLRLPVGGWAQFQVLATKQLRRNFRRNGVKRGLHPPPNAVESLIRLGCAVRIIDEVVGESPVLKSDLGYR